MHKLICEYLLTDYTRKGSIHGLSCTADDRRRFSAASSAILGLAWKPPAQSIAVSRTPFHPSSTVQDLLTVFEASRDVKGKRRALHLPRMNVRVGDMLHALGEVACPQVCERVHLERNKRVARMVANWVKGATVDRALALDLCPDASFKAILERHIQNCWRPTYPADSLQGLSR